MPALFVFLLKVNIALLLFCAGYYLVLRHLTFYTLNRIYLVAAILFATVYPQINLDSFAQRHQQLTQPVQVVLLNLRAPAETLVKPLAQPIYWQWAEIVFFAGAAFLAIRLLMQLVSLYKVYRRSNPGKVYGHSVRIINGNDGPFSFWKNIYVNPSTYEPDDLRSILQHEQIHADEWHTLDILLAELSIIFYWFNPGIWLMRKAVRENIEFITDRKILKKGTDSKKYQYSLLHVSFAAKQPGIANHFNISTLKKRIIMMNAKRSSQANLTRYAFLVPVLLVCLFAFSFSKAELIKKSNSTYKTITSSVAAITNIAVDKLDVKAVTALFGQKDTIKLAKHATKDTIRFIKNGATFNYAFNTDTNKVIRLSITDSGRVVRVDGRPVTIVKGINIDTNHITKVRLNGHDINSTYTYSINTDTNRVNKVRLNGVDIYNYKLTDDTNKVKIRRGSAANGNLNQAIIMVDGVKLTGALTIDPANIESVDVLNKTTENPNGVIVITTKGNANSSSGRVYTVTGSDIRRDLNLSANGAITYNQSWKNSVSGRQKPVDVITVTGHTASDSRKDSLLNRMRGLRVSANGVVTHDSVYYRNGTKMLPGVKLINIKYNEASIDHLSDKLTIINGKEASARDLKKLRASDIESMNVKRGPEMIKQYGDKAKNGVLFITTKAK